ncbi:MAG TPA: PAS domain S-box protein [Polyangiaceae bacterium]|nr:PAS domain S-box protein [Polyangiaceae bacterium]
MSDNNPAPLDVARSTAELADAQQALPVARHQHDSNVGSGAPAAVPAIITHQPRRPADSVAGEVEDALRSLVANLPVVLTAVDREGVYVMSEGGGLARAGARSGELVGKCIFDLVAEVPGGRGFVERALAGETVSWQTEFRGGRFDVLMTPRFDASGAVVGAFALSIDTTERVRAEEAHRRSEARFRALIENSTQVVVLATPNGSIVYASPALGRLLGRAPDEVVGKTLFDLADAAERELLRRAFERTLASAATSRPIALELDAPHRDGSLRSLELTLSNQMGDPAVEAIVVNLRDLTEQRQALLQRRAAEERCQRIVETTSEGVWLIDTDAKTTFVNERMAEMLGYEKSELIGMSLFELLEDELHEHVRGKLEGRRRGVAESHELRYRKKDGSPLWAMVKTNLLVDATGKYEGALALLTDITDRWQIQAARNQLAAVVASSDDAITGTDPNGIVTAWNRGCERLYGYAASEVIGRSLEILLPEGRYSEETELRVRTLAGEVLPPLETTRLRKDGTLVEVALTMWAVRDADGKAIGTGRLARDLSERRKADALLKQSQRQLLQSQKMEAVGNLAGGVAHDFNNFLSLILTFSSLALDNLPASSGAYADIQQVMNAAQRAADLTRQLLTFSSQEVVEPQVVNLSQRVANLELMLARLLGETVRLRITTPVEPALVYADPVQIDQVTMNLALNARDAMPQGGLLSIEIGSVTLGADDATAHPEVAAGRYVLLAVTDQGTGIAQATLDRIFEPFFTTKPKGKGTGLGLSTVFGIVKQVGGHLEVATELGQGTTFRVYFPRAARAAARPSLPPLQPASLSGTETLLVVEDDDSLRAALRTVLAKQGYRVLEAQNGSEALMISQHFQLPIHLLLTDVVMPRMSGRELVPQLLAERPELKVLYMSGYAEKAGDNADADLQSNYLAKPISPAALLRKLREALDAPAVEQPAS